MSQFERSISFGPVRAVPDNYTPKVVLSDEQYDALYASTSKLSPEQRFYARDYAVLEFQKAFCLASQGGNFQPVDTFLAQNVSSSRLEALFWGLNSCTCCWRHVHNAPVAVNSDDNSNMLDRITHDQLSACGKVCRCYCRSAKRELRRAFFLQSRME